MSIGLGEATSSAEATLALLRAVEDPKLFSERIQELNDLQAALIEERDRRTDEMAEIAALKKEVDAKLADIEEREQRLEERRA